MKSSAGKEVKKALIYSDFESKDQILKELMQGMIKELVRKKGDARNVISTKW
jgi:hypothetical protein